VQPVEFWFSIGSIYTWLAVTRVRRLEQNGGAAFDWRPFSVRAIMIEMDNLPRDKPRKLDYIWKDVGRRARRYGLEPGFPAPYPLDGFDLANRVARVARHEGWCEDYVERTYRRWLEDGQPAGSEPNLSSSVSEAGQEPGRVIDRAGSSEIDTAYTAATDEARRKGIFGVPSFVVGGELFWGEDRLDDALQWARDGTLS
jgi:2-hydroxychromene-2-carboxylate isomerase